MELAVTHGVPILTLLLVIVRAGHHGDEELAKLDAHHERHA
jgi:hypothetical protein